MYIQYNIIYIYIQYICLFIVLFNVIIISFARCCESHVLKITCVRSPSLSITQYSEILLYHFTRKISFVMSADLSQPQLFIKSSRNKTQIVLVLIYLPYFQYTMTETRGRALLISNEYKLPNGSYRKGSEHDYRNMRDLLVKLGFVVVGGHQNYTAKVLIVSI